MNPYLSSVWERLLESSGVEIAAPIWNYMKGRRVLKIWFSSQFCVTELNILLNSTNFFENFSKDKILSSMPKKREKESWWKLMLIHCDLHYFDFFIIRKLFVLSFEEVEKCISIDDQLDQVFIRNRLNRFI